MKKNSTSVSIVLTFSLLLVSAAVQAQDEIISGELVHMIEDDFDRNTSKDLFYIKEKGSKKLKELKFSKGKAPEKLLEASSGSRIKIRGKKSGDQIEVNLANDEGEFGGEAFDLVTYPTTALKGLKRVLAVRVNFSDEIATCVDETTIQRNMFDINNDQSTKNYYRKNSSNLFDITGEVTTVKININAASVTSCTMTDINNWTSLANTALINAGYTLSNYDNKMYYLPVGLKPCGWAGKGYLGGTQTTWVKSCNMKTIAHELGHNYGLHHASSSTSEYGDLSDSMGGQYREFNSAHKHQIGWVPTEKIQTISSAGTFRVSPLNSDPSTVTYPQVYRVYKADTSEWYYLSYRTATGSFDSALSTTYANRLNITRYKGSGSNFTHFVDALGASGSASLASTGFSVTNLSTTSSYIEFNVGSGTSTSDTTAPSVSLSSPANGATYTAGVTVSASASASDNVGVAKVEFYVGGVLKYTDSSSPYSYSFSMPTSSSLSVYAKAYDAAGNVKSSTVSYIKNPTTTVDTTAPSVSLTSPSNGATYSAGATVSASASASDNVGVVKVEFYVNSLLKYTDSSAPYSYSFSMPTSSSLSVYARAYDAAGNVKSSGVSYIKNPTTTVDTIAPSVSLSSPSNGATYSAGATVSASASASDNVGVAKVEFYVGGSLKYTDSSAPYSYSFSMPTSSSLSVYAKAYDAAGNNKSSTVSYIKNPTTTVDTTPPSVPLNLNASVSKRNTISLTWSASSDNVQMGHYEILRNGVKISSTTSTSLSQSKVSDGTYNYQVRAVDKAGNASALSSIVEVSIGRTGSDDGTSGGGSGKGRSK